MSRVRGITFGASPGGAGTVGGWVVGVTSGDSFLPVGDKGFSDIVKC